MDIDIRGGSLRWLESTGSTNDVALALGSDGAPHGTVVAADTQTSGRGRFGREWVSPPGLNAYLSIILRPSLLLKDTPLITLMCGVASAEALEQQAGVEVKLKWPNDRQAGGRKLGGILVESRLEAGELQFAVAGIGININSLEEDFTPEVRGIATSLKMETTAQHSRSGIFKAVAESVIQATEALERGGAGDMLALWRKRSATTGCSVRADDSGRVYEGTAEDIDDSGRLLIRMDSGEVIKLISGDVFPV